LNLAKGRLTEDVQEARLNSILREEISFLQRLESKDSSVIEALKVLQPKLKDLALKENQRLSAHEFLCQTNELPTEFKEKLIYLIEHFQPDLEVSAEKESGPGRPAKSIEESEKAYLEEERKRQDLFPNKDSSEEHKQAYRKQRNKASASENRLNDKKRLHEVTEDLKRLFLMKKHLSTRREDENDIRQKITGPPKND
jgi:hypothetical protein